jgi:hypothetical protein
MTGMDERNFAAQLSDCNISCVVKLEYGFMLTRKVLIIWLEAYSHSLTKWQL